MKPLTSMFFFTVYVSRLAQPRPPLRRVRIPGPVHLFCPADRMDTLTSSRSMFHGRTIVRALAQAVPNFTSAFGERKKRGRSESHEENNHGGKRSPAPEEPRGQRLSIATNQQIKDLDFLGQNIEIPPGSPIFFTLCEHTRTPRVDTATI